MRSQSRRNNAGCRGERGVCAVLAALSAEGVQHLDDCRLRDETSKVNLDHVVITRSGVFVLDTKNWAGRIEVRGNSVLQDGVPRDERLLTLAFVKGRVDEVLATSCAPHLVAHQVVCFSDPKPGLSPTAGLTRLTDVRRLPELLRGKPLLEPEEVLELTELLAFAFPPYETDPQLVAEAEGLLFPDMATKHAGLERALTRPVEEWMVWLHPSQASAVRRSNAGPARIRGAAGTGKTSVGLHRIAWLASTRPGRFLVTSYVKTLPPALQRSYVTLSPRTAERIDFLHLHDVARRVLEERGLAVRVTPPHCTAFDDAWRRSGGPLAKVGLTSSYFRDEILHVIKGRGLESEGEYLSLDRMGRGTPLRADARRALWLLFEDYEYELRTLGLVDSVDVLRLARDAVRRDPDRTWAGVLVDEAQDIPLVGLQLLHELAGRDRHDGLLVVGDGQQSIYPGGYRLKDAGIDVSGRAVVLDRNYRNTVEILATASAVVAADRFDDLEVSDEPAERLVEVVRHGQLPTLGTFESAAAMDEALVWDLAACLGSGAVVADVAVLVPTNRLVEHYLEILRAAGFECVGLASAKNEQAVRVGTWHRSKGMEFAHVFMPASDFLGRLLSGSGKAAEAEKAELLRRAKYVAMTRARDTLWVGSVR